MVCNNCTDLISLFTIKPSFFSSSEFSLPINLWRYNWKEEKNSGIVAE